jgi:hypothetical protein
VQPLFVFCADLHLEDGAWSTRPGIYGDAYYSFAQIIDYCIAHSLPLILGGDVLEKKQNLARPIAKLCAGLSRMEAAGVPVYYIQGNHEYDRNAPWLSVHTWPQHIHQQTVTINGAAVYGLDWLPKGEIQDAFAAVPPDTDILITHQVWKDFMGNVGRTECELTDVHHVQVVLAGDFHVTKVVESVNAQSKPIKMLSPGSTAMQDMGEDQEKSFFVIAKQAGAVVFDRQMLKTRGALNYVVKDVDTLDQLCAGELMQEIARLAQAAQDNGAHPDVHKPLVKVKFDKQLPDAYLRITTTVGEAAHLFCEALADRGGDRQTQSRDTGKNDLLSALAELLGDTTPAYKLAAGLLSTDDPGKELDAQFKTYMGEDPHNATSETGSEELGAPSAANV